MVRLMRLPKGDETMDFYKPDELEARALLHYAQQHGRVWRHDLAMDWYNARTPDTPDFPGRGNILHGLRNHPLFGHEGLAAYKLPKQSV
jgi:hypothetical protein